MTSASPEARARLNQRNFIKQTVQKTETNFETLCGLFGAANRKTSYLRDKYDEIAAACVKYGNLENGTLKTNLNTFAEHISAVQDYRQAQIDRTDARVVQEFKKYKLEIKNTKADLQRTLKLQSQHDKKLLKLEKIRRSSPSQHQNIERAKTELDRAEMEVNLGVKALETTIDKFEQKKINDLKKILMSFLEVEMLFHAKALELYTDCMKKVQTLDCEEHLELFRNTLHADSVMMNKGAVIEEMHGPTAYPTNPQSGIRGNRNFPDEETDYDEEDDNYGSEEDDLDEDYDDEEDDGFEDRQPPQRTSLKPF